MKKYFTLILMLIASQVNFVFAQNTWTGKTPLPIAELQSAAGFSIGTKGYVVTGIDGGGLGSVKLWEYDQATNTWTSKADFPGATRYFAVAFAIGNKGYVGTGTKVSTGAQSDDFWEWDQATDTWTQKQNFAGTPRKFCAAFALNGKGYIGSGWDNTMALKKDFYEYDPATNAWTAKANLPTDRYAGGGFAIGNKGYICSGGDGSGVVFPNDLQEYDPTLNTWTAKASLPASGSVMGAGRNLAFAFSIGTKGFIGTGTYINSSMPLYCQDFWEYDQPTNAWTQRTNFPGGNRQYTFGFSIGNKGYAGSGEQVGNYFNDLWEWGSTPTGINEGNLSQISLSIYPNPSNDVLTIMVPLGGEYSIYNTFGQTVSKLKLKKNEKYIFDPKELSSGTYILKSADNYLLNKKFNIIK